MHTRKSLPDMRCYVWLHVPCVHHMVYGAHRVHEVSSASDHQLVTVSACMNHAAGLKHLPFILYKLRQATISHKDTRGLLLHTTVLANLTGWKRATTLSGFSYHSIPVSSTSLKQASILSFIMGDVSPPLRWAFLTHKHQCHLTKKAHYS